MRCSSFLGRLLQLVYPQQLSDKLRSVTMRAMPHRLLHRIPLYCMALLTAVLALQGPIHAQEIHELGPDDRWQVQTAGATSGPEAQLAIARRFLAENRPERAYNIVLRWIRRHPGSPELPMAHLIKGDALVAMTDYYESLYDYEYIARAFPGSNEFKIALEREFEIARMFATGTKRKWLGLRIAPAIDEAEEILIRIQERMPGSQLAEQAGLALGDLYFRQRRMNMAADAYAIFIERYPRSPSLNLANYRLIIANIAAFKGPRFDIVGLLEAKAQLHRLQTLRPAEAEQIGAGALVARIEESEATKLLTTARWYQRIGDPIAAEVTVRALVRRFPRSSATAEALAWIPSLLLELPPLVRNRTPDYELLRTRLLGLHTTAEATK